MAVAAGSAVRLQVIFSVDGSCQGLTLLHSSELMLFESQLIAQTQALRYSCPSQHGQASSLFLYIATFQNAHSSQTSKFSAATVKGTYASVKDIL